MRTFHYSIRMENGLRTLQRMTSLLTRYRLKVYEMKWEEGMLHLALQANDEAAERLLKQLRKLVDVSEVRCGVGCKEEELKASYCKLWFL